MGKIGNFICKCGLERMGTTHYLQDIARPILMFCAYGIGLSLICREYPPCAIEWSVDTGLELQKEILGRVYPILPNTKSCFVAMLLNARGHRINHWLNVIHWLVDPLGKPIPVAWLAKSGPAVPPVVVPLYMNLILTMVKIIVLTIVGNY